MKLPPLYIALLGKISYNEYMEQYKKDFIDFMVSCKVLSFGSFTLKSGRKSPFFMNAGAYITGGQLQKLGEFYARAIHEHFGDDIDVFFGPAYKGIPLGVAAVIAYSRLYGREIRYCSNRKEAKDHGADKGLLLGSDIRDGDRVLIIEDVTTSGKSIDETVPILKAVAPAVNIVGEVVSLNRMERAQDSEKGALEMIEEKYGFPVRAIVTMKEVVDCLYTPGAEGIITDGIKKELDAYYAEWGIR